MTGHAFGDVALPGATQGEPRPAALGLLGPTGARIRGGRQSGQGPAHGVDLVVAQGRGYRLHDRIGPRPRAEVADLLGQVAGRQTGQARKSRRRHAHPIGAVATGAGHGCGIGAALREEFLSIGSLYLGRQQQRTQAGQRQAGESHREPRRDYFYRKATRPLRQ
ncbi:hypothetical protein D3C80_1532520 [compost metagenome]